MASKKKQISNINKTIASINKATTSLGKEKGVSLTQLGTLGNTKAPKPPKTTSNFIGSSDNVVQNERNIRSEVGGLSVPSFSEANARKASEEYLKVLSDQMSANESQRKQNLKMLNDQYDKAQGDLKEGQVRETGTYTNTLQRIGGYLGGSASGAGAINNLAESHRGEIAALTAKRAEAINAANNAVNAEQFKLAQAKAKEAKDLEEQITKSRQDFFDNSIRLNAENRAAQSATDTRANQARDDARTTLNSLVDDFGGIDITQLEPDTQTQLQELADAAGIPLALLRGPTLEQQSQYNTQQQRAISNSIAYANLALRRASAATANALSPADAQKLGLPRALVGMDEQQLYSQINDDENIPDWFLEFKYPGFNASNFDTRYGNSPYGTNIPDESTVKQQWNSFRNEVVKTSSLVDFGDFGLPPTGIDDEITTTE